MKKSAAWQPDIQKPFESYQTATSAAQAVSPEA